MCTGLYRRGVWRRNDWLNPNSNSCLVWASFSYLSLSTCSTPEAWAACLYLSSHILHIAFDITSDKTSEQGHCYCKTSAEVSLTTEFHVLSVSTIIREGFGENIFYRIQLWKFVFLWKLLALLKSSIWLDWKMILIQIFLLKFNELWLFLLRNRTDWLQSPFQQAHGREQTVAPDQLVFAGHSLSVVLI